MIMGLYQDKRNPTLESSPPGTCVPLLRYMETQSATVEHLPIIPYDSSIPPANPNCLLRFENGTATKQKYEDLSKAIHPSAASSYPSPYYNIVLPTLLQD